MWNSLPAVYRQCAVYYTDFWISYEKALPERRHKPVSKESGKTNHIERFNNTMRQRISRLVRETLSFSCETRKPRRSHLVFYSSLQCFFISLISYHYIFTTTEICS